MRQEYMKAAMLREFNSPLSIEDIPVPVPKNNEVLVKIMASGLCGSDLHIQEGKVKSVNLPYIPGHEMAGEVVELGKGCTRFSLGDHVVAAIDITCGHCRFCRIGRANLCRELKRIGFEVNGSHAQYAAVPERILFKVSKDMPWEKAAVIPDAVSCMLHSIKGQGKVRAGDRVCFLGIGGLGLQGLQIAKHFGAEVICTSRQDKKLEIARKFGSDHCINTKTTDLFKTVKELSDGEMCDVVFDNIGISSSIEQSLSIVRPGGKVIVVGYIDEKFTANYQDIMINEKEIIGIRASNQQDLVEAIKLVEKGFVDPYVFDVVPLTQINEAMDRLRSGGALGRTILLPNI